MTAPGDHPRPEHAGQPKVPGKQPFVLFDLGATPGRRDPLPVPDVPPQARAATLHDDSGEFGELGELVVDDGTAHPLDRAYVIGRAPQSCEDVAAGRARALVIDDETGGISRVHARVGLGASGVELTDLGSRNGTQVLGPGESHWRRIVPNTPVVIRAGARIAIGRRCIELRGSESR